MTNPSAASRPALSPDDRLVLVDGSGFIFRAYHALPPLTRKSDRLPVGAVAGFCNMLWKLICEGVDNGKSARPTHMAVIFDYSAKTFRSDLYADYKAHRPEPPTDLVPQFGLIRQATRAFNIPAIEQEGFEADDLIATYACRARDAGASVVIVSADKDLMQLVRPGVSLYDTLKNRLIGREEVIEKFGVPPEKVVDVQALAGDAIDNVPGVPGIGVKTAALLVQEHGDLESILAHAGSIKQPKRREALQTYAEQARVSKRLVTLDCDMDLKTPIEDLALRPVEAPRAIGFLKALEFSALTRRVAEALGADAEAIDPAALTIPGWDGDAGAAHGPDMRSDGAPGPAAEEAVAADGWTPRAAAERAAEAVRAVPFDLAAYACLRSIDDLRAWVAQARARGLVAFDTETTSLFAHEAELVGFSLALEPGRAAYVPLAHRPADGDLFGEGEGEDGVGPQIPLGEALDALKALLEDGSVLKIGQNIKYDWLVMRRYGIRLAPYDDTMLLSYALDAGRNGPGGHGMDELSTRHLGHKPIPFKEVAGTGKSQLRFDQVPIDKATTYAAEDADVTLRLWQVLKPRLIAEGMVTVYETLERPMAPVLAEMENRGIAVDRAILSRLSGDFAQKMARLEAEIFEVAGERFNIGSPKQLGDILFGRMNLPGGKKTKTGAWATDANILEDLAAAGHELPRVMLEWRQVSKLKSTYTDALQSHLDAAGRVHTCFSLASTTTGRLSSTEPNLQNIPVRTEDGRRIRAAFVAEAGNSLVSADYSQIELRLLAHMADVPALTRAFRDGLDIHAITASEVFGVPVEGMEPQVRRRAKAVNFGIIYGISPFGLANQIGSSREEAREIIDRYFKRFPGIRDYMEETKRFAREHGYVTTLFGRRCHYPEINTRNHSLRSFYERAAINAPIQGTAADIIRRAMIRMPEALEAAGLTASMLLQVHDELVFEAEEGEAEKVIDVARKVMQNAPLPAVDLAVPLLVEAKAAENWEAAH
jgi:DNA polymerase-1